jgi:L-malate glycosyltransferase
LEEFGTGDNIRVIHNFVNCDMYRPDPEKSGAQRYCPPGDKILIHVSNFRPVKRALDCVRILAEARKDVPAHLLMVGDGPDRSPAERLARDLHVERHVTFLGKQDHVERLFPQAHVLLMPSELEGFGLAALEGMACGVPPVATNVGGVPELVTHGVDGYLESVGDIAAQSARVCALLAGGGLYEKMSQAARATATTRFCTDRMIPKYEDYYREVCR